MTNAEKLLAGLYGYLLISAATKPISYRGRWREPKTIWIGDIPATILIGTDSYSLDSLFASGVSMYAAQPTPVYDMSTVTYSNTLVTPPPTASGEQGSAYYPVIAPPTTIINTVPVGGLIGSPDSFETIGNDIWFTLGGNPTQGFKYTPGGISSSALQAQQVQTTAQKAAAAADSNTPWYESFFKVIGAGIQKDIVIGIAATAAVAVLSQAPKWYEAYERTHKKKAA